LGYHIERQRERSGKISKPFPFIFENIIEAFLRNNVENQDLIIVPITINYDKIFEG
jgi:glycerol-3-phosphate O-acyltransferase